MSKRTGVGAALFFSLVVVLGVWTALDYPFSNAAHVPLPTMAVDTDIAGNSYTADPNGDGNNQDNRMVAGAAESCSLVPMPALGTTSVRVVDVLLKNSPNTIITDIRLILRDSTGAQISPDFAEIVSFNPTPFSDNTQDTDRDGNPPPASGGTGTDAPQPVGFVNLPVDPGTVGTMPGSTGGFHRSFVFVTGPSPIPPNTVNAFATVYYLGSRDYHMSADHPHSGTEIENGTAAPYQSDSASGVTIFRVVLRLKNLSTGANGNPFFVGLDLAEDDFPGGAGAGVSLGTDLNGDGDFNDTNEEESNRLPEANLADGGLQVGGTLPSPCPPPPGPTRTPTPAGTSTATPAGTPTATPTVSPPSDQATMAVDTDTSGNTYTADPNADGNNQDNRIAAGGVDACSLLAMPVVSALRTVDVLLKNAPEVPFSDIRLNLRDTGGALISSAFAEIVAVNATPFVDGTQDTDFDGTPDQQLVGFLNLPVVPSTVGTLTTPGGTHITADTTTSPQSPLPAAVVSVFGSAIYRGERTFHMSPDHPHNGTENESTAPPPDNTSTAVAPYVSNSASGVTIFRVTIRVKNQPSPYFVQLDLGGSDGPVTPGSFVGELLSDEQSEANHALPEARLADGGLQVGGTQCPPGGPTPTPMATATPTITPVGADIEAVSLTHEKLSESGNTWQTSSALYRVTEIVRNNGPHPFTSAFTDWGCGAPGSVPHRADCRWQAQPGDTCFRGGTEVPCEDPGVINGLRFVVDLPRGQPVTIVRDVTLTCPGPGFGFGEAFFAGINASHTTTFQPDPNPNNNSLQTDPTMSVFCEGEPVTPTPTPTATPSGACPVTPTPTPTSTPTPPPAPTPTATPPATTTSFVICNDTGQPVTDLHVMVNGYEAVSLTNAPGCPAPAQFGNSPSGPRTQLDLVWPTACVDPFETVTVSLSCPPGGFIGCSTPPQLECFHWTRSGTLLPSADPCQSFRQPMPFATFPNTNTEAANDLHFQASNFGLVTKVLVDDAPGCADSPPPPPATPTPTPTPPASEDLFWPTACVDPGESVSVAFFSSTCTGVPHPCLSPGVDCFNYTLDGSFLDSPDTCGTPTATPTPAVTPTATATPTPAGDHDGHVKKVQAPASVAFGMVPPAIHVGIENQGDHTEQFGVYVDIVPPGGVGNPYGCTPAGRVLQTVETLNPGQKRNVFAPPLTFDCADRAGAAGMTYTIMAAADVHTDDAGACTVFQIQSMTCFNALADDDTDDSDNRRSANRPRIN